MKLKLLLAILISVVTTTNAAEKPTQHDKRQKRPEFSDLDLNSDQKIDLSEFKQHKIPRGSHEQVFSMFDADGNGSISEEEFKRHKPPRHPPKRNMAPPINN